MKKNKFLFLGIFALLIVGAIFYFRDTHEINEEEIEQSIEETTSSSIEDLNDDTFGDDFDESEIEEAPLALDTTKVEK
ncbi:MAG: hypothetical protein ACWA41_02495 [Putridiphycobacter sp.]